MLHAWLVASPLHWPRIKNRRVGDIVALIDAALDAGPTRRLQSSDHSRAGHCGGRSAKRGAAFSSTDGAA